MPLRGSDTPSPRLSDLPFKASRGEGGCQRGLIEWPGMGETSFYDSRYETCHKIFQTQSWMAITQR